MILRMTAACLLAVVAAGTSNAAPTYYVGLQGGYDWSESDVTIPNYPANFDLDTDGFVGGLFAGVSFPVGGAWSLGVEGDVNWTDGDGSNNSDPTNPGNTEIYVIEKNWNGSLRGRIGYACGKTQFFGTLGWVWAEAESFYIPGGNPKPTANVDGVSAGLGVEHDYEGGWFARAEYRYSDTDEDTVVHGGPSSYDLDSHTLLLGAGYKFGG